MAKGEDGVYTGVLTLPKGTGFDLKILKSTVDGTSGGVNVWSAVRYKSVLNSDGRYDFGEFTGNLVPNGDFEDADAKWTPTKCVAKWSSTHEGGNCLMVGDIRPNIASSDTFVIPPNQDLRYSTYVYTWAANSIANITIKDVDTQSVLFEAPIRLQSAQQWVAFSGTFKTGGSPVTAQVVCTSVNGKITFVFDSMSLVSP